MRSIAIKSVSLLTLQLPASLETKKYITPLLAKAGITTDVNEYPTPIADMTGMLSAVQADDKLRRAYLGF